ncbi:MAG: hypothetical protein PUG60_15680 [Lachnospiraceae bacterium]|nr:hypothetical protein [Lachnospiraceae bacterium]
MRAFTEPEMKVMAVNMKENIASSGTVEGHIKNKDTAIMISYSGDESKIIATGPVINSIQVDQISNGDLNSGRIPNLCWQYKS